MNLVNQTVKVDPFTSSIYTIDITHNSGGSLTVGYTVSWYE